MSERRDYVSVRKTRDREEQGTGAGFFMCPALIRNLSSF